MSVHVNVNVYVIVDVYRVQYLNMQCGMTT